MGARNIRIVEAVGSNPICSILRKVLWMVSEGFFYCRAPEEILSIKEFSRPCGCA